MKLSSLQKLATLNLSTEQMAGVTEVLAAELGPKERGNFPYLYVFSAPSYGSHEYVKIGVSKNPEKRLESARAVYDHLLEITAIYPTTDALKHESAIKQHFKEYRRKGTEFFAVDLKLITAFIETTCGLRSQ